MVRRVNKSPPFRKSMIRYSLPSVWNADVERRRREEEGKNKETERKTKRQKETKENIVVSETFFLGKINKQRTIMQVNNEGMTDGHQNVAFSLRSESVAHCGVLLH